MKLSSSTFIIDDTPKDYKMNINNIENKFLSLAYGCYDDIAIIRKFDINSISKLVSEKIISQVLFPY